METHEPRSTTPVTPPKSNLPDVASLTIGETPQKGSASQGASYRSGNLDTKRQALLADLPAQLAMVPIDDFISHLLPPIKLSKAEQNRVFNTVKRKLYDTATSQWNNMTATGVESVVFRDFGKVQNDIIDTASTVLNSSRKSLVIFKSNGDKTPSSKRYNKSRPDGNGSLRSSERRKAHEIFIELDQDRWERIFRADEYKVKDNEEAQNDVCSISYSRRYFFSAH